MQNVANYVAIDLLRTAGSTEFNNLKKSLKAFLTKSLDDYKSLELDNDSTHIQQFNKKQLKEKTNILKDFSNIEDIVEYSLRDIVQ